MVKGLEDYLKNSDKYEADLWAEWYYLQVKSGCVMVCANGQVFIWSGLCSDYYALDLTLTSLEQLQNLEKGLGV